ncbi:glycoside hydrolase family 43 protein [Sphingomonas sp. 4RDLI-65]|uniref:glycoside hydrolase family 43 protein n=1 Tax=Sphingomonas sp. 4RDLI-65 TaxID=3111641 RepID=UPI003C1CF939
MIRAFTLVLAIAAAFPATAQTARFERFTYRGRSPEQVSVKAGEYRNPILSGYYPDPSITRVGGDYYLVNSSFAYFPGIPIWHSIDLVNWTQIGNAIDRPGQLDLTGRAISQGVFAPDISYHAGLFYIVTTCVGCKGNFVITAKTPQGPWSDPIWLPTVEGIDPSIYWEGDRAYIVNNRAPDEPARYEGHRAIWLQEYDWRAGRMLGESTQLINGGTDIAKKPVWIEGPHIFKRGAFYYLTAAEGGTGVNHSQVVFRSNGLRGPFVPNPGNPILTQRDLPRDRANPISAAGHADLIETQNGEWWAPFLAVRPYAGDRYTIGRETFLLPVTWRNGWPSILEHGKAIPFAVQRPRLPTARPSVPPTSGDFGYTDAFDGCVLPKQWIGIRTPKTPVYRLANGGLELDGGAAIGDLKGVPAFVGRRQQHHIASFTTTLRYVPTEDGARAGLAAVQSDQSSLFFGLSRIAGKPMVALYTRDKTDIDTLVASAPVDPSGSVTLAIRANAGTWSFDYRVGEGRTVTLKADLDAALLTTERAGGFVGTVVGPYVFNPRATSLGPKGESACSG